MQESVSYSNEKFLINNRSNIGKITKLPSKRIDKAEKLEEYTRKRICESKGNISIKSIASETGYSECYIRRTFEKVNGITPKLYEKYVRFQLVIRNMEKLDKHTKLNEVATKYGYYDQSHMSKEFKQFVGMTPEKYRKMEVSNRVKINFMGEPRTLEEIKKICPNL
ncbi:MAG: AraC family transcriptional regulator [Eubacteriales bacterium]